MEQFLVSLWFAILAAIGASFVGSLSWRLHEGVTLRGFSLCTACRQRFPSRYNLPIIGFVMARARAACCGAPIPRTYILIEILFFALAFGSSILVGRLTGDPWAFWPGLLVLILLGFSGFHDWRYGELHDALTIYPAILLAPIFYFLEFRSLLDLFFGILLGGGFFGFQFLISRGRWVGDGDIMLGVLLGVLLGLAGTALTLWLAYVLGAIYGIYLLKIRGAKRDTRVPFGFFLALAGFIVFTLELSGLGAGKIINFFYV